MLDYALSAIFNVATHESSDWRTLLTISNFDPKRCFVHDPQPAIQSRPCPGAFGSSMPVIRLGQTDDVSKLAAIERDAAAVFRDVGLAWVAASEPLDACFLAGICEQQMLWVASSDRVLVGFLAAERLDQHFHITEVSVVPSYQKQGIGSALMGTAIDRAAAGGFKFITLTTYRDLPWNGPFYARLGFSEIDAATAGAGHVRKLEVESVAGHDPSRRCVVAKIAVADGRTAD